MDDLPTSGNSTQFRALYYLGSQMAQALTEFVDEEGQTPQASWTVTAVDLQPYAQVAERFARDAAWGVIQFTEQPGGAFLLVSLEAARSILAIPQGKKFTDDHFALLDILLNRVTEVYSQAWADMAVLDPQLGTFPEAPSIGDLQEIFMGLGPGTPLTCTSFRVSVPAQPLAKVVLAIPQPYLIPLASSLEAAAEMTYLNGNDDAIEERLDHLADVPIPIQVTLGTATMTLAELQNLEEEDVIVLDQHAMSPLSVDVGGARIWAKPGTTLDGMRRAVEIVRLGND